MGFTKPIEQFLFSNLLTKIHVFMYLKDIIRGVSYDVELDGKKYERKIEFKTSVTWGCEDTVISFDNDSVRFELTGSCES